jgi:hypothetical protein
VPASGDNEDDCGEVDGMAMELSAIWPLTSHFGDPGSRQGEQWKFLVDKAALGYVFSEYFRFPCQSSFHQFIHHHYYPGLTK